MFCCPELPVVSDIRHVALLLVAVVALDRTVVHGLLNLGKRGENKIKQAVSLKPSVKKQD